MKHILNSKQHPRGAGMAGTRTRTGNGELRAMPWGQRCEFWGKGNKTAKINQLGVLSHLWAKPWQPPAGHAAFGRWDHSHFPQANLFRQNQSSGSSAPHPCSYRQTEALK